MIEHSLPLPSAPELEVEVEEKVASTVTSEDAGKLGQFNLLNASPEQFRQWFTEQGEKTFRAHQVMKWLYQHGVADFNQMSDLAKSLRQKLLIEAQILPPTLDSQHLAADGTRKYLFSVDGNNKIETVFIPEVDRGTLCISTQAGCALNCSFCRTGKSGFNRNLTTAEIIGQLWQVNAHLVATGAYDEQRRIISNVVLMGMGEPLANYEATLAALKLMLDDHAYGLSRRRVTLSTAGIVPKIDALREDCPVSLAVSLHAPNDDLRDVLVPINQKYPLAQLLDACVRYLAQAPRDFITFEYAMLADVNDSERHAFQLIDLTKNIPCKFNLIPFNPFPGTPYQRSPALRVRRFAEILQAAGRVTTTRKTRGDNIQAACGQLAGEIHDKTARHLERIPRRKIAIQSLDSPKNIPCQA